MSARTRRQGRSPSNRSVFTVCEHADNVQRLLTNRRPSRCSGFPPGRMTPEQIGSRCPARLMERLTARAIREGRSVEAVVAEILEAKVE